MIARDAFYLPGFDIHAAEEWFQLEQENIRLRAPVLTAGQLQQICATIVANREHLLRCSVDEIVRSIDAAAGAIHTRIDETTDLLHEFTGYSPEVVRETLDHMFADWRGAELNKMLRAELGDPRALDDPVADPNIKTKRVAAYGYPLAFHIFSGNVPGVAVTSLIRSLLIKSATLGKLAAGEPILPVLFAQQLAQSAPQIAACIALTYWPGGTAELESMAIHSADAIVVYGGETAVRETLAGVTPDKHVVVHGPRLSFGVIGPHANQNVARHVAHAVAAYDQQGCVSPHLIYVVGPEERARTFAQDVAEQLDRLRATHPRSRLSVEEAVAIRSMRAAAEFADAHDAALFGAENAGYSVIYERDPVFKLSCLNRVLFVKPIAATRDVPALLPERRALQSAAVEGFSDADEAELIRELGLAGVSRVTSFERLPWPPMHWHHDGSAPLRELLYWQDIET